MSRTKMGLAGLIVLCFCACVPLSSKNPLGNLKSDPALIGTWESDEFRMIIKRKGRARISIALHTVDDDEEFPLHYKVLTSRIEDLGFMSIKQIWPNDSIKGFAQEEEISVSEARAILRKRDDRLDGWYLAHYKIKSSSDGDELGIYLLDEDNETVIAALADQSLSGGTISVEEGDGFEEEILYLTSSTKSLTHFIARHTADTEELFKLDIDGLQRQ